MEEFIVYSIENRKWIVKNRPSIMKCSTEWLFQYKSGIKINIAMMIKCYSLFPMLSEIEFEDHVPIVTTALGSARWIASACQLMNFNDLETQGKTFI